MLMYLLPNRFVENMYTPYPIMQYGSSLTYTNTCVYYPSTNTYTYIYMLVVLQYLFDYDTLYIIIAISAGWKLCVLSILFVQIHRTR